MVINMAKFKCFLITFIFSFLIGSFCLTNLHCYASSDENNDNNIVKLNDNQKDEIENGFMNWAAKRAQLGGMVVSDDYLNHGVAGMGDWFANTPNGRVQVQNQGNPGSSHFKLHAIGGCIFGTSTDGKVGRDDDLDICAEEYQSLDNNKPMDKYLLADNGVVYELKNQGVLDETTGFCEYSDDGTNPNEFTQTDRKWVVSKDKVAQHELKKLINEYK